MYAVHCPSCVYCGARLIWRIQRFHIPRQERIDRCRRALKVWTDYGHSETEIRRLAKLPEIPLAPIEQPKRGR